MCRGGVETNRERWREKGELIFLLGLCISWLGNRVEMERKRLKRSCFGKQPPAWQGPFSGASLASCAVKRLGVV